MAAAHGERRRAWTRKPESNPDRPGEALARRLHPLLSSVTTLVSTVEERGIGSFPEPRSSAFVAPVDLEVGLTLPGAGYRLETLLARRPRTEIFGTTDPRTRRKLAIKVLRPHADPLARECLLEEIRLTRRISSTRVVRVVRASWLPDGRPWYAMTRPSDRSLDDLLERRRLLAFGRTLRILRSTALAVAAAHRAGIVHRDVKPSNLLIDAEDKIVLIDFGIATEVGRLPPHHSGTPRYMAPDQADDEQASPTMDVYALGCIAYEMLLGTSVTNATTLDGVRAHRRVSRPAAWRNNLRGRTPPWLRAIVERCLHPDPDQRYRDAFDVARALQRGMLGA